MPYDPTLPAPNSPLESQVIRDQLQALFVLINNIASIAAAQVDSTNTAARTVYQRLGFADAYAYHYRTPDPQAA